MMQILFLCVCSQYVCLANRNKNVQMNMNNTYNQQKSENIDVIFGTKNGDDIIRKSSLIVLIFIFTSYILSTTWVQSNIHYFHWYSTEYESEISTETMCQITWFGSIVALPNWNSFNLFQFNIFIFLSFHR
jgi:hypothetical protein